MLEINKIHQGDCLELMKQIDNDSIDMILCDLPYGTTACKWDMILPLDRLWKHYKRIIKDKGAIVLTASQPFTSKLIMNNPEMFRYEIIWNKVKSSNFQLMNFQVGRIHENILIFSKSPAVFCNGKNMNYNPQKVKMEKVRKVKKTFYGNKGATLRKGHTIKNLTDVEYSEKHPTSIYTCSNANIKDKSHPTEKPVNLFKYLIRTYTNGGDLVLDNCIGSGTTAVACKQTKRNFIGIEKEQKYVDIANERLEQQSLNTLNKKMR